MKKILVLIALFFCFSLNAQSDLVNSTRPPTPLKGGAVIGNYENLPTGVHAGQIVWYIKEKSFYQYNGTAWEPVGNVFSFEDIDTTQVIDIGDIGTDTIEDGFNLFTFTGDDDPVQQQSEGYVIVNCIREGIAEQYLFLGQGGSYGTTGSLTADATDFTLLFEGVPLDDVWREITGSNKAYSYTGWARHQGNIILDNQLYVGDLINSAYGNATARLRIAGAYGAEFRAINSNHSSYIFNSGAPSLLYSDKTFNNVVLSRDYSFVSGSSDIDSYSLEIKPTLDFSGVTGTNKHTSILIDPNIIDLNGSQHKAIDVVDGLVDIQSGKLKVGDYTLPSSDGTANQVPTTDGNGNVTWQNKGSVDNTINKYAINAATANLPASNIENSDVFVIDASQTDVTLTIEATDNPGGMMFINIIHEGYGNITIQGDTGVTFTTQTFINAKKVVLYSDIDDVWKVKEDNKISSFDSSYRVNVLDFFDSDALRDDVINRNPSQNIAETTEAIEEAIQYCITNDIRELVFGSGLYITNRILFSDTDNFSIIGEGATLQYNSNTSIFQFVNCDNVTISGFEFTSILASDLEVYFLRIQNNNSYFKIFNNRFTNFPRNAIIADNLSGGTYTEGITIYMNEFVDSPNYSNPLQSAIALGEDGEYSKVINNNFYNVPSAARFVDGANGLFAYNNVLNCNGDAYGVGYDNAIVYSEFDTNSAKLDIVYNKINHNTTGIPAVVIKGDPTKPQNACKIQGNDVLVHGSTTKSMSFYIKDAPYTIITDNKIRGNSGTPNDNAIYIEDSDEIHLDKNYISYYNNGVNIVTSTDVFYGENSFTDITTNNYVVDASSNVLKSTNYGGDWNASTNTPTLANTDTNVIGQEYRVSASGSVDFGSGSISFSVGDIVANNGIIWYKKVDNDQSSGVAGIEEAPNDGTKYVRQNEGWVAETTGSSGLLTAVKTVDETKTEDTTVALDSDLQITLEANSYYDIEVQLLYTAGGVPDFRTQFEVPSGSDGIWWRIINDDTFGLTELTTVTSHNGLGTTTEAYVRFFVNIYTDSTSGTFGVKWAQNSSSTIITTLQKGSSIKAVKLN